MIVNIIIYLAIGALVGWLAGRIMKTKTGIIGNILVGVIGGVIGGQLLGGLFSFLGTFGGFITSVIGAILLLFVIKLIKK